MLPLVQWQEISFAQPAALTWSNFTLLFSGERRAGPNSKVLGMAYIGCSCLFKGRAEFSSISETYVCTCLCVCFFLAQQFISEILGTCFFCSFKPTPIPFRPGLFCSVPSWPLLLKFLHPPTTFTVSFSQLFLLTYFPAPPQTSPLSLPLSLHRFFTHYRCQLSLCFVTLPSVALYSQWMGPMDKQVRGSCVCFQVCVCKFEEKGRKR